MAAICEERVRSYIRAWGGLVSVVDVCLAEAIPLTSQERRRRWSRNAGLARHTWWAAKSGGCVGWRGGCGGEDRVTCASRRACLRQPAEQSDRDVVSRRACLYYQGRYVLETRQTKPTNEVAKRDGELEKPGGLSSRCSPQHSVPDPGAADPRAQAFTFLGMRSRKQGRAGVGAWRDAKMTICSQKKTVRSRRHKALNWLFCLADA